MFKRNPVNLDFLRLFAALLVTAAHARSLTFADFDSQEKMGFAKFVFFWITSIGHASVLFFYVLSGFLVGGGIAKSVFESKFDMHTILINRLTRIWIALIPSLLLVFFLNQISCQRFISSSFCRGELPHNLSGSPIQLLHNFELFLKTAFFIVDKDEGANYFGGNQVLWTLQYEVAAYLVTIITACIASFFIWPQKSNAAWYTRVRMHHILTLLFLGYWVYSQELGKEFILYLLMFAFGTISYLLSYYRNPNKGLQIGTGSFLFTLIVFGQAVRIFPIKQVIGRVSISDLIFSILIAFLLSITIISKPHNYGSNNNFWNTNFSFSLYLTHLPIQGLILGFNQNLGANTENSLILFLVMMIISLICAKIFATLTEDRTFVVRKKILRWMHRK